MGNEKSKSKQKTQMPTSAQIKTYLMIAKNKLTLQRNKKVANIKAKENEIAKFMKDSNIDIAKAKMDSIIREEDLITAYDILGPLCEMLLEKVTYIMTHDTCPDDLAAIIESVIYASSRIEMEELHKLRELVTLKYGTMFIANADQNVNKLVNVNLINKLKVQQANDTLIVIRLKQFCQKRNIQFDFGFGEPSLLSDFNPSMGITNPYESNMVENDDFGNMNKNGQNNGGGWFDNNNNNNNDFGGFGQFNQGIQQNQNQNYNNNDFGGFGNFNANRNAQPFNQGGSSNNNNDDDEY